MHHIALCTQCIALFNCGHLLHMRVDHKEPKPEVQAEQAQVEASTNLVWDQGKPRCIKPPSLNFVSLYVLIMILRYALGYRSCIDALVA
jgi:hypothetical protein